MSDRLAGLRAAVEFFIHHMSRPDSSGPDDLAATVRALRSAGISHKLILALSNAAEAEEMARWKLRRHRVLLAVNGKEADEELPLLEQAAREAEIRLAKACAQILGDQA